MKQITILTVTLLLLVFIGCEERFTNNVEFDLPEHESKIVSYCFIENNDDSISVAISQSIGTLDDINNSKINNAHIKLLKEGELLTDVFVLDTAFFPYPRNKTKIYKAKNPDNIEIGQEYSLEVSSDNLPTIYGNSTPYSNVKIEEVKYTKDGTIDLDGNKSDEIEISFYDPADEENYYIVDGEILYELISGEIHSQSSIKLESKDPRIQSTWGRDINLSPKYTIGEYGLTYFSDADGINGKLNKLKFFTNFYGGSNNENRSLKIKIYSIPKDMYFFLTTSYSNDDFDIFSEPADITSNMKNGFGMFSMFSYDEFEVKL